MKNIKRFIFILSSSFPVNFIIFLINSIGLILWRDKNWWWISMTIILNLALCLLTANVQFNRTYLKAELLKKKGKQNV